MVTLLRVPSISTLPEHKNDIGICAQLCKELLKRSGCDRVEIFNTEGNPVVFGEKLTDPAKPTVLVYGHYDVQPVDPLDAWETKPFQPVIKNGKIFARGASDDKGQLMIQLKAFEILVQTNTTQNNIKFMIEGEEEIGSPNLNKFIKDHRKMLKADLVLISDSSMLSRTMPSLEISFRGSCAMEIEVTGPDRDLHSGIYGGAVANPIIVLSQMLASLHKSDNSIAVPGFYDNVLDISSKEKLDWRDAPFDEDSFKKQIGVIELWGEKEYSPQDRIGIRPAIDVNGIWGGYLRSGMKSIIPCKAHAKISSRIVPNQLSSDILQKIADFLRSKAPGQVKVHMQSFPGGEPYRIDTNSPFFRAAAKAIESTYGKPPVLVHDGGTLPICYLMAKELGIKSVLLGFGLPDDNLHSPNEKFDLNQFFKGILTILNFHGNLSENVIDKR